MNVSQAMHQQPGFCKPDREKFLDQTTSLLLPMYGKLKAADPKADAGGASHARTLSQPATSAVARR